MERQTRNPNAHLHSIHAARINLHPTATNFRSMAVAIGRADHSTILYHLGIPEQSPSHLHPRTVANSTLKPPAFLTTCYFLGSSRKKWREPHSRTTKQHASMEFNDYLYHETLPNSLHHDCRKRFFFSDRKWTRKITADYRTLTLQSST